MSVEAIAWVLNEAPVKSPVSKLVLIALANHAHPDGTAAFPSVATICRYTCLSERSVRQHLEVLESAGVIRRCDESIVAAYIKRADRRPIGYDIVMSGVHQAQVVPLRGAGGAVNGVQEIPERGAGDAPKPSNKPSKEPHTGLIRDFGKLVAKYTPEGVRPQAVTPEWSEAFSGILSQGATEAQIMSAAQWAMKDLWWRRNLRNPMMLERHWERLMVEFSAQAPQPTRATRDGVLDDAIGTVMNFLRLRKTEDEIMDYIQSRSEQHRDYLIAHLDEFREAVQR